MLKRNRIKWKQGNKSRTTRTEGKALTRVSAFFDILKLIIVNEIHGALYSGISGTECSGIVACFKMKTEHKNLHRNKANNMVLHPPTHQQLKEVVSKCLIQW